MPTNVLMPQLGESIAEGTIVRWIKKVGEAVDRDEPLFEISTDKVDAEIPSPAGGVLAEIYAQVGETVAVNSVVAVIGAEGERVVSAPGDADTAGAAGTGDNGGGVSTVPSPEPAPVAVPRGAMSRPLSPVGAETRRRARGRPDPARRDRRWRSCHQG